MGRCLVFCAGGFDKLLFLPEDGDYILAADGGLTHLNRLGLEPRGILGDFDSLGYIPQSAQVFPVEKDDTDAMLAARRGLELGYREFIFYGALDGDRLDHTLANYQMLQFLADHGANGTLVGRDFLVTVVKDGALVFPAGCEGIVSVFCMGAEAAGVDIQGLYYSLSRGTLSSGFPLGVSNRFTGSPARIAVTRGSLLILWQRGSALPERREIR